MKKNWKVLKLADLCSIELGRTPSRCNASLWDTKRETGNVWLSISDLLQSEGNIVFNSKEYISDKGVLGAKIVQKGTLLVSFKLTLGRLAFAGCDLYTNEAIAALTIFNDLTLSKEYLFYFLHFFDWNKAAEGDEKIKGKTLNKAKLKEIPVLVPPLPEQKRIVAILDEAFAGIATATANAEKNLANARELFEATLSNILTGNSERWSRYKLEEMVEANCALSYGIVQPGEEVPNGLPIVRPTDLTRQVIDLEGLKRIDPAVAQGYRRTKLLGGELLLCVRGSTGGISIASSELVGGNVTRGIVPIRFSPSVISQKLGYYLFLSKPVQDQIRAATYGTALMQINIRDLRQLVFIVPPSEDQPVLLSELESIAINTEHLKEIYEQKLTELANLKQAILRQAFSGDLTAASAASLQEEAA